MARDYKHEYQLAKNKENWTALTTRIPKEIAEEFKARCAFDGITPNAALKAFVCAYANNTVHIDGESIKAQK